MRRELPVVKLTSPEVATRIGLQTAVAEGRTLVDLVEGNAETAYNAHLYADVLPRVRGVIREVEGDHGMACEEGDVLAVVDSADVGAAKAAYLAAGPRSAWPRRPTTGWSRSQPRMPCPRPTRSRPEPI